MPSEQAHRELAAREAHLRAILDAEPECVKLLADDGALIEMNPAGLRMIEADSFQQVDRQCLYPLVAEEHRAAFRELTARVFRGQSGTLEFQITGFKGTQRWLETHASPLRNAAGAIVALVGVTRDVTRQKEVEAALRTRARQQETAARLAQRAITASLPGLFDEASAVVADTLSVELCKVLELLPGGAALRLVAGVGWHPGLVGRETVPAAGDSQAGFTLASDAPVIVEDLRTEARFRGPALLTEHGVVSGMSVPIRDAHRAWGVMGVHTREHRRFTDDDVHFLETVAGVLGGAIKRGSAEAALRDSEQRYGRLLESAPDATVVFDRAGRVIRSNAQAVRLFGYSREEFLALTTDDLMPSRYHGIHARHFSDYVAAPHARRMGEGLELWALRKDGSEFPCEISLNYDRTRDDAITVASIRDVSERRRVEVELRQAQARLDLAARMGGVGLWDRDLRTNVCWRSPEWKAQVGCTDEEIGTTFDAFTSRVHPDDLPLILERERLYLGGVLPTYEAEFRFRHKDGSYRQILSRGATLLDADGRPARLLGAHVDITEVRQLEAQFRQSQKMESVGRLAGGIAHDFNNVLTVINGVADMALANVKNDDPLHADLKDIRDAGERAAALTHQLLAFSRRQILKPEVVSLNPIIEGIESMLHRLIGEHIELVCLLGADLGNVRADRGQIEQVILNLAVNARDAMPEGGRLTIETRAVARNSAYAAKHPSVRPGPHVLLAISDTGTGIDEAIIEHVFDPFFTTKGAALGTGLGLATVYGIVKQSGGSIEVDSEINQGTTFRIYLPSVAGATPPSPVAPSVARTRGTETILLAEDERAVRELARRVLSAAGYTVLTAAGSEEALRQLERHKGLVHLLLTDLIMPGMSGRELAERVAVLSPTTRVLYTSGYTDDDMLRAGVSEDAVHFIAKPYTPSGLARQVRELLDQGRLNS